MTVLEQVSFSRPLANSRDYPAPAFPAYPVNRGSGRAGRRSAPAGATATFYTARARYALAMVARARLKPGDTVLLPAYHCPAMVEPFLWAGCSVSFYRVTDTLAPVATDIVAQLPNVQALLLVHYFGFQQDFASLVIECRNSGCLIIEDLAHAAFQTALQGDVAVTSLAKFYPQPHGAEIWCADSTLAAHMEQTLSRYQKGLLRWRFDEFYRRVRSKLSPRPRRRNAYRYFREIEMERPAILCRPQAAGTASGPDSIEQRRRVHYQRLLDMALRSRLGRPLYPVLPADCVPCVFPFLLHSPAAFQDIRNAGVPLFRWEELVSTDCAISSRYLNRLIQIPCHQDMNDKDFALIEMALAANALNTTAADERP